MRRERSRALLATLGCVAVAGALSLWWRPAISMPDAVRIPIAKRHGEGAPRDAALFRHGRHDTYGCAGCHPSLFPEYPLGFTHAEMREGRFCGTCHDGRAASDIPKMACEECHVPR